MLRFFQFELFDLFTKFPFCFFFWKFYFEIQKFILKLVLIFLFVNLKYYLKKLNPTFKSQTFKSKT